MERGIWETNLAKNFFFNVLCVRAVSRLSADTPGTVGDKRASKKPCEEEPGGLAAAWSSRTGSYLPPTQEGPTLLRFGNKGYLFS